MIVLQLTDIVNVGALAHISLPAKVADSHCVTTDDLRLLLIYLRQETIS